MDLDALIAKAKADRQAVKPFQHEVLLGGELVTVQGVKMDGQEWRAFAAEHPPRPGIAQDLNAGYDVDGAIPDYPFSRVVDNEAVAFPDGKWAEICSVLDGPDLTALGAMIWSANVYEPAKARREAGKASTGVRPRKRRSPGN